jgi:hypothetical protein
MLITFGKYGHVEDEKKEKEYFLEQLNFLMRKLNDYPNEQKNYNEKEIVKPLKDLLKREINSTYFNSVYYSMLCSFLGIMGLCYYTLTPEEKEVILNMDYTYENFKEKSPSIINNFIARIKKAFPASLSFCFDDIYFILHMQIVYREYFSFNNFVIYVRDYYILDDTISLIKKYRDDEEYNKIKKRVIDIYPELKEKYGMNRILEKIVSFITKNTDYDNEITKKILDDYYYKNKNNKKENEESIRLKDKQD